MRFKIAAMVAAVSALGHAATAAAQAQAAAPSSEQAAPAEAPALPLDTIPVSVGQPDEALARSGRAARPIEEVVVTAQRREERLQDVPISITVFNQEQLTQANIANSADLARYTPSLAANPRFGAENATFTIRGFTQDLRTTASVGTYFAEVVAPRGQATQTSGDGAGPGTLFDLQNVQVLKGPQGTLFGRNTTGGAILLVPQKPTHQFEGFAEFTGGEFDTLHGQGVVNVPLNDRFRLRLGIDHNQRDGFLDNISRIGATELGDVNYTAGRLSAVWDITDELENYTILSAVNSDTAGYTNPLFACNNPLRNLANPQDYDVQALIRGLVETIATGDIDLTNPLPGIPLGGSPFALITFGPCEQQLARQEEAGQNGFFDVASTIKTPITQLKERRFINTTTWQLSDTLTFKNILAYAHLLTQNGSSNFGIDFPDPTDLTGRRKFGLGLSVIRPDMPVTSQQTWVEEMQLQGSSFDNRFVWQTGLYYEHSTPDGPSGNGTASFAYCDFATLESGDPTQWNCFDPYLGILGGALRYEVQTEYLNQAVFAQGTYHVVDEFSVTLGLRYTWDETEASARKELYRYLLAVRQPPVVTFQTPSVKSSAPTGMLEFAWRPNDSLMAYAKYTRGYRQGTVNTQADPGLDTHEPETVDTYEIGMKSSFIWPVPGRFNVAVFDNTLTDMQLQGGYISSTTGPTTAIFNAGEATSRGFEIEAFFQPLEPLTVSLSYSLLDTELVKSADFCSRVVQVGVLEGLSCTPIADVGDELPFAPDSSYVASLDWTLPVGEHYGRVNLVATYAYTGKQRVAATSQSPYAVLEDFGLLNLNLNWAGILGKAYDFSLFATNVTDEEYAVFTGGVYRTLGIETRMVGMPRVIGARLRYNF